MIPKQIVLEVEMIRTKLNLPVQHTNDIARNNVIDKLNQKFSSRLFLIIAGAGYGKSTSISQWLTKIENQNCRVGWISLDHLDNDPIRFMSYFVTAIQMQLGSGLEEVIERLESPYAPNLDWVMMACINAIDKELRSNQRDEPLKLVLALDDFHFIKSKEILAAIDLLITYCPENFKLVLISREIPDLSLVTYRSKGWLIEISSADLAFNHMESLVFLKQVMETGQEINLLETLIEKTEGWAAGLQLAALAISKNNNDVFEVEKISGNHPFILEYLTEQVLKTLPENERILLMLSSISDRFCIELALKLLKSVNQAVDFTENPYVYFQKKHYFIISLDAEKVWFRFHHLFSDVLCLQLKKWIKRQNNLDGQTTLNKLHLEASIWFLENGHEVEGFQHAVLADEIDLCTKILHSGIVPFLYRGGAGQAIEWLCKLPAFELNKRPWLWMIYASASLHVGKTDDVEIRLVAAENSLIACETMMEKGIPTMSKGEIDKIKEHIASIRAVLYATQHHMEKAIEQAQLGLKYADENSITTLSSCNWALGYAKFEAKDYRLAQQYFGTAKLLSQTNGPLIIWLMSTIGLGKIKQYSLSYEKALMIFQEVFDFPGHKGYAITCDVYYGWAQILYQQGDIEAAETVLDEAIEIAKSIDRTDRKAMYQIFKAKIMAFQGEEREALFLLEKAEKYCKSEGYTHLLAEIAYEQGLILLKLGNLTAVEVSLKLQDQEKLEIRLKLAKGEGRDAIALLEKRIQIEFENLWLEEVVEDLILHALACYKYGVLGKSLESLQKAVELSHQSNSIQMFITNGLEMLKLLRESNLDQVYPEFIRGLIKKLELEVSKDEYKLIEPLTTRELEVLKLIANGYSNETIAQNLFLATSSVKGINQRIFSKLQVDRRTEAVLKAKLLGWID